MGKKSRKQQAAESKLKLCPALTDKGVVRLIDTLLERTSKFSPGVTTSISAAVWEEYDAIVSLVQAIKQRQGPSPMPLPSRQEAIPEFVSWLCANNVKTDKIEIFESQEMGYGLKVLEAVKEEDKVIEVPKNLFFSKETVVSESLTGLVRSEPILTAMPNLVLALLLLNERYSPTSFWRPYINILPQCFNLPLYFSKEDLMELQGSPVLIECISQVRNISRLYAILHRQLRIYSNLSLPLCSVGFHYTDFVWAVCCVMSRQNKVPSSLRPNESQLALIPLWDMANHAPGRILSDFDTETQACISYSMSDLPPGAEFRIFYGPRGNGELLINQGFTVEGNPHDIVKIWIGTGSTKNVKLHKILDRLHAEKSGYFIVTNGNTPFTLELVKFVRLFTASEEQLLKWETVTDQELKSALIRKVWSQDDQRVLEFLEKRCQLLLVPYKTSIEDDERLLSSVEKMNERQRNNVTLRLSEKRILVNAANVAAGIRKRLEEGEGIELDWTGEKLEGDQASEPAAVTAPDASKKSLTTDDNEEQTEVVKSENIEPGVKEIEISKEQIFPLEKDSTNESQCTENVCDPVHAESNDK